MQACEEALRHAGSPTAALGQLHTTNALFVQNLQQLMAGELSPLNRSKVGIRRPDMHDTLAPLESFSKCGCSADVLPQMLCIGLGGLCSLRHIKLTLHLHNVCLS